MFAKSDYSYILPKELIAQESVHPHHNAKLMVVSRDSGSIISEATFWEIDAYIPKNRVLYFNNSRVEKARIRLNGNTYQKENGEQGIISSGEILFTERKGGNLFEGMVRPGKKFRIGTKIYFQKGYVIVREETENGRIFETRETTIEEIMEHSGELPLPPYIEYKKEKEKDYQTSFAMKNGSIAAPTASLHFTKELLDKLSHDKHFLTLHVGLGTFKGLNTADVRDYQIHAETVEIEISHFEDISKEKKEGKYIIAVGTTACRSLESMPHVWVSLPDEQKETLSNDAQHFWNTVSKDVGKIQVKNILFGETSLSFQTEIYIYPGIPFRIVDELITNFHLPESSLLLLVGAFTNYDQIMNIYHEAIKKRYRFFSFGDGMYIKKN